MAYAESYNTGAFGILWNVRKKPKPKAMWLDTTTCFACGHVFSNHLGPNTVAYPIEGGCWWLDPLIQHKTTPLDKHVYGCDCMLIHSQWRTKLEIRT